MLDDKLIIANRTALRLSLQTEVLHLGVWGVYFYMSLQSLHTRKCTADLCCVLTTHISGAEKGALLHSIIGRLRAQLQ